jgi:hypothetical protein
VLTSAAAGVERDRQRDRGDDDVRCAHRCMIALVVRARDSQRGVGAAVRSLECCQSALSRVRMLTPCWSASRRHAAR